MTPRQIYLLTVVALTLLVLEFIIKPPIKKRYGDKSWYGLLMNILMIVLAVVFVLIGVIVDDLSDYELFVDSFAFFLQVLGAIFVYELGANIVKTARALANGRTNGNNKDKKSEEDE